jgi:arylsulfatase A-like enzyme/GH35 family endo-1,4-beta-xylanase
VIFFILFLFCCFQGTDAALSVVTGPTTVSDNATTGEMSFSNISVQAGDVVAIASSPNKSKATNQLSLNWSGSEGADGNAFSVESDDLTGRACYVFYVEITNSGTYDFTVKPASSNLTAQSTLWVLRSDSGSLTMADTAIMAQTTSSPGLSYSFSSSVSGGIAIESFAAKSGTTLTVDSAYAAEQNSNGRHTLYSTSVNGSSWSKTHTSDAGSLAYVGAGAVFSDGTGGGVSSGGFPADEISKIENSLGITLTGSQKTNLYAIVQPAMSDAWRTAAESRISSNRMADLTVQVVDSVGTPVPNADVHVELRKHDFKFGGVANIKDLTDADGNLSADSQTVDYWKRVTTNLFNAVGGNNGFKPRLTGQHTYLPGFMSWASANDLDVRAHLLIWPGGGNIADLDNTNSVPGVDYGGHLSTASTSAYASYNVLGAVETYADSPRGDLDKAAVKAEVDAEIAEWAGRWDVYEWDVINETRGNNLLQQILGYDQEAEWFNIASNNMVSADTKLFINENQIISAKSASMSSTYYTDRRDIYFTTIDRLVASNAPIHGIGFQNRYKWEHPDPAEIYSRLNDFSGRYSGIQLAGTEFEIKDRDPFIPDEFTRAQITEETLTVYFSHPNATGLNAWSYMGTNTSALCDYDGTIKLNGLVWYYLHRVRYNTDTNQTTSASGETMVRGYKGDYDITVTYNNTDYPAETILLSNSTVQVTLTNVNLTPVSPQNGTNVLFIAIDDCKPAFGCYDDEHAITPHIDGIASSGVTFLNAQCQWAVCGPSRASLSTSLFPEEGGVMGFKKMRGLSANGIRDNSVVRPNVVTLQQWFRYNGYRTAATGKINDPRCVGSMDTSTKKVNEDGSSVDDPPSWGDPVDSNNLPTNFFTASSYVRAASGWSPSGKPSIGMTNLSDSSFTDGKICDEGIVLLQNLAVDDTQFFLGVGFKKPHLPFVAPQKYWDYYQRDQFEVHPFQNHPTNEVSYTWNYANELVGYDDISDTRDANGLLIVPEAKQKELIHGYYACVSFIDAQIGRLLTELESQNLHTNTIVVIWGDHGFHLGDHSEWAKHTNIEQAARVPLIIYSPFDGVADSTPTAPANFVDIYPTLCELAGLSIPEQPLAENEDPFDPSSGRALKGKSLVSVMNNPDSSVRTGALTLFSRSGAKGYSYRTERYRYIEWIDNGLIVARELYDYERDPMETINLAYESGYDALMYQYSVSMRAEMDALKASGTDIACDELQNSSASSYPSSQRVLQGLKSRQVSTNLSLSWPDAYSVAYNVMESTNLVNGVWTQYQGEVISGDLDVPLSKPAAFYRVEVAP